MSLLSIAFSSFVVAFSGALSPGPMLFVTMSRSIPFGPKEGPLLSTGHAIVEFIMMLLLITGFGYYLKQPAVVRVIGVGGGCVLVCFGIMMLVSNSILIIRETASSNQKSRSSIYKSIITGMAVSLSNPYWFLWWITVGLMYLSIALPRGIPGIVAFFSGHISADFLWYSIVSTVFGRGIPAKLTILMMIIKACGLFLIGFGIFLMIKTFI